MVSVECECVKMGADRVVSSVLLEKPCGPLRISLQMSAGEWMLRTDSVFWGMLFLYSSVWV